MNTAYNKSNLTKNDSEMEKLEQSKKSQLRMISSSVARLKLKYGKTDNSNKNPSDTNSKNIRMYETHNPGFCYLRNGEYRKNSGCNTSSSSQLPIQCAEKIKAILFTNNELDVHKTMCLHLLGTHIQNKNHIQRKDGRLCSFVKAQTTGNVPQTLQPITQRMGMVGNEFQTKFDKMLPRYILNVTILQRGLSTSSVKTNECDNENEEESKRKRKLLVPIYINNKIRLIINSVLEALDAVESSKLSAIKELASSPEGLRNMLANEELQDFIIQLANNPLVLKPTSYDYVMAHLMFDKIPEKGTMETVAQVLEIYDDPELKSSLCTIRRNLFLRHLALINSNILPGKGMSSQDRLGDNTLKPSTANSKSSMKLNNEHNTESRPDVSIEAPEQKKEEINGYEKENQGSSYKLAKGNMRSVSMNLEKTSIDEFSLTENSDYSYDDSKESYTQSRGSTESYKCDFRNLTNSQRILLGLKVASLKCKPINMHQLEGKKKIDLGAIISPIIKPQVSDINYKQNSHDNHLQNFSNPPPKKVKKSTSNLSNILTDDLENLSRALLVNLRLEISESENKKRVKKFMNSFKKD